MASSSTSAWATSSVNVAAAAPGIAAERFQIGRPVEDAVHVGRVGPEHVAEQERRIGHRLPPHDRELKTACFRDQFVDFGLRPGVVEGDRDPKVLLEHVQYGLDAFQLGVAVP